MIHQCEYFPRGIESVVIFPETGGVVIASVPYINVNGDSLPKRMKLYDFENADYPVPVFTQRSMINRQLRHINAKSAFYDDLHAEWYKHTQQEQLAA